MLAVLSACLTKSKEQQVGRKGTGWILLSEEWKIQLCLKEPSEIVCHAPFIAIVLVQLWSSELIIHPAATSVVRVQGR